MVHMAFAGVGDCQDGSGVQEHVAMHLNVHARHLMCPTNVMPSIYASCLHLCACPLACSQQQVGFWSQHLIGPIFECSQLCRRSILATVLATQYTRSLHRCNLIQSISWQKLGRSVQLTRSVLSRICGNRLLFWGRVGSRLRAWRPPIAHPELLTDICRAGWPGRWRGPSGADCSSDGELAEVDGQLACWVVGEL
jgi:hypothetical protein